MDFLTSAGKALKSAAKKVTDIGYVVTIKMPKDVYKVITTSSTNNKNSQEQIQQQTKDNDTSLDQSQINFTLERLGVLSGSGGIGKLSSTSTSTVLKKGQAAGKFCFYIQLPDPSRSDSYMPSMNMMFAGKERLGGGGAGGAGVAEGDSITFQSQEQFENSGVILDNDGKVIG